MCMRALLPSVFFPSNKTPVFGGPSHIKAACLSGWLLVVGSAQLPAALAIRLPPPPRTRRDKTGQDKTNRAYAQDRSSPLCLL